MLAAWLVTAVSLLPLGAVPEAPPAPSPTADGLHRPLHIPKLKRGARCPVSPTLVSALGSQVRVIGRGPAFLVDVGRNNPATIYMNFSFPDEQGWYAQKTPWMVSREYDGPLLVRGARIDRRGQVRFAKEYGEHLPELYWEAGADQSLPRNPNYRFLASSTLVRARGCYAFQLDGESFSRVIVVRVRG